MGTRLWFISDEKNKPVKVFPSRKSAELELEAILREDPEAEDYKLYPVTLDDLEEYPAEFDLAEEEGYI